MHRVIMFIGLSAFLLSGCGLLDSAKNFLAKLRSNDTSMKQIVLETEKQKITLEVEVADDEKERDQGLMNREKLEEGKGMWFIFPDEAPRQFWMKNTLIPLDILFFNSNKKIVHIVENMEPCRTPQCITYFSEDSAMYALEVRGGFVKAYRVRIGDKVTE